VATYAIGDVQGCHATLKALLTRIAFDPKRDRIWLVGDLVNRGPSSAAVLRTVRDLGDAAVSVLGNHDLHLIARYAGVAAEKPLDTLDDVLGARDAGELVDWLARRPLVHREGDWTMVHAGFVPDWSVDDALANAHGIEAKLRDPKLRSTVVGKESFSPALKALVTVRTVKADGSLCKFKGAPKEAPKGCVPWFEHPARRSRGSRIVFGHWAALGYARGADYLALDSGCVWGNALTAVRLEDGAVAQEKCRDPLRGR
jgi:bis(5'-nucleosyl)-tetraphosphatase (symmetrical)